MKMRLLPLSVVIGGLLAGCGGSGGGGGGYTPQNVTWSVVMLKTVEKVDSGCAIYHEYPADPADPASVSEYVIGHEAPSGLYHVVYHNADGSIVTDTDGKPQIFESNATSQVTFDLKKVPDGGYVSLEESSNFSLSAKSSPVSMISIQKDLVTDMTLTVDFNVSFNIPDCVKKTDDFPELMNSDDSRVQLIPIGGEQSYQLSASAKQTTSDVLTKMPVFALPEGTEERKLATGFSTYDSSDKVYDKPSSYAIVEKKGVFLGTPSTLPSTPMTSLLNDEDGNSLDNDFTITANNGLTLNQASVDVVLDGKIYSWQKLFEQANGITESNWAKAESDLSIWAVNYSYNASDNGDWDVAGYKKVNGSNIELEVPTDLSAFDSTSLNSKLSASGYTASNWDIQRTYARTYSTEGRDVYQSIYAKPNAQQPLMQSSIDGLELDANPSGGKVAITLLDSGVSSNKIAFKSFMAQHYSVTDSFESDKDPYENDLNGILLNTSEKRAGTMLFMQSGADIVSNTVNL